MWENICWMKLLLHYYETSFEFFQEEECNDNYVKNCFLTYETKAMKETVKICRTPLVKDCNTDGEEICRTEYESECWTKQEEHEVEQFLVFVLLLFS